MSTEFLLRLTGRFWAAATSKVAVPAFIALTGLSAMAQVIDADPDWKEVDVPSPPALSQEPLIAVDMPIHVSLKFGVDPASLTISKDGVVRYVMVAKSASGATNTMYEGIRCSTGEYKTYARQGSGGQWSNAKDAQWRPLNDDNASRHALALARQGVCEGRSVAANNVAQIIAVLKNPQQKSPP